MKRACKDDLPELPLRRPFTEDHHETMQTMDLANQSRGANGARFISTIHATLCIRILRKPWERVHREVQE
jgi:hypothetical protein